MKNNKLGENIATHNSNINYMICDILKAPENNEKNTLGKGYVCSMNGLNHRSNKNVQWMEVRTVQIISKLMIISLLIKSIFKSLMICHVGDDLQIEYHYVMLVGIRICTTCFGWHSETQSRL